MLARLSVGLPNPGWHPAGERMRRIPPGLCKWAPDAAAEAAALDIVNDVTIGELLDDRLHPAWHVIRDILHYWDAEDRRLAEYEQD
jgi:hypothetical protein